MSFPNFGFQSFGVDDGYTPPPSASKENSPLLFPNFGLSQIFPPSPDGSDSNNARPILIFSGKIPLIRLYLTVQTLMGPLCLATVATSSSITTDVAQIRESN